MQACRPTKSSMHSGPAAMKDPKRSVRFKLPEGILYTTPDKRTAFENTKRMEGERHPLANDSAWHAQQSSRVQNLKTIVESHLSDAPPPSLTSADFPELGSGKTSNKPVNKPVASVQRPWGPAQAGAKSSSQKLVESKPSHSPASTSKGPKRLVAKLGNIRCEEHFEDQSSIGFGRSEDCTDDEDI
jgi:hypothetical protein